MRRHYILLLAFLPLLLPLVTSARQAAPPTQAASSHPVRPPKWTETDRRALIDKAHHGDVSSQFWLGAAYEQGWFGKTNFREALKWFRMAASQDNADAQNSLGQMYEDGEGVKQNCVVAAAWYRKAAEHAPDWGGAGQGRNHLGLLYLEGLGVTKDYVQAYMWFRLASNGDLNLSQAKSRMTPADILEGERLAAEWKKNHPEPQR